MKYIRRGIVMLFLASVALWAAVYVLTVRDKDQTPPQITGTTDEIQVSVGATDEELLAGLTAFDDRDGDITDKIRVGTHSKFIHKGSCEVQYYVFDSSYNVAQFSRRVTYTDYESPRFILSSPLIYEVDSTVSVMSRVSAKDDLDGDISGKIKIVSSNVNEAKEGVYSADLEVTNEYGDVCELEVPVHIVEKGFFDEEAPQIVLNSYLVYLKKGEELNPEQYLKKVVEPDESEGNLDDVQIENGVDTSKEGIYEVTYTYESPNGKSTVSYLIVAVTE
ncbi:MAG: bacterial Ig-like domain-containing protein [Lachnospiraceae bacterium]|nr:bacterial Ig-like domain-containing protein [Lachnospiraceae bacterium]